ncbi:polysaccharide deacetylase family protein [Pseudoclavibacter soli]|uniref:polysaccharide deacetylase family protein n=1 Tax=Pseudoclavibacter soli TaxID=452623 RepID=UPI000401CB5A|nr:polysaccharide deacetylase family protein [Pseudoclavibacter soli]
MTAQATARERATRRARWWIIFALGTCVALAISVITLPQFTPVGAASTPQAVAEQHDDGEVTPHISAEKLNTPVVAADSRTNTTAAPVLSITFDDGTHDQISAANILSARGLTATFFVISGYIDQSGFLTREDLTGLEANGNEIGGHTIEHYDLAEMTTTEMVRAICADRANLISWGHQVRSLAYPYASSNRQVQEAASECGYSSARGLGQVVSPLAKCDWECARAESLTPQNALLTQAPAMYTNTQTLTDLQDIVRQGQTQGAGWTQLTFHGFCEDDDDPCSSIGVSRTTFTQFADWVAAEVDAGRLSVRNVGNVIGGDAKAVPLVSRPAPAAESVNAAPNATLTALDDDGVTPRCWRKYAYGSNASGVRFSTHNGVTEATVAVSAASSGDAKLLIALDQGDCSPSVRDGHRYRLQATYRSDVPTQFVVYARGKTGAWRYLTASTWYEASADDRAIEWTTDQLPEGVEAISFGLNVFTDGSITTKNYGLYDAGS